MWKSIQVDGAAASSLVITDLPTITTAGSMLNMTITAYDANGDVATGYTGTVQFMSTDPQAASRRRILSQPPQAGVTPFLSF